MYKAEFFAQTFDFVYACLLEEDDTLLSMDYLTLDACSIEIPRKNAAIQKGCFCRISRVNGGTVQEYLVEDSTLNETSTSVSLRPLQALLDVQVYNDGIADCAAWITQQVQDYLISSSDTAQNRPIVITNTLAAASRPLCMDGQTVAVTDVLAEALTAYRCFVDASLDIARKRVIFTVQQADTADTLEADLANVLQKEITLEENKGSNKLILRRTQTDKDTGKVTVLETRAYYLHPDGTVNTNNRDRLQPVVWSLGTLEDSDTWDADALAQAAQELTPSQYNNEIRLDYQRADPLVQPETLPIGTKAVIYAGGKAYKSLLTGREWEGGIHRLIFGCVRVDLTKKLILDRRKKT